MSPINNQPLIRLEALGTVSRQSCHILAVAVLPTSSPLRSVFPTVMSEVKHGGALELCVVLWEPHTWLHGVGGSMSTTRQCSTIMEPLLPGCTGDLLIPAGPRPTCRPPSRVHTVCLYFSPGASIERGGPFEVHVCMAGREYCLIEVGPTVPRLGSIGSGLTVQ